MTIPSDKHLTPLTPVSASTALEANLPAGVRALECTTPPLPGIRRRRAATLAATIGSDKPSFSLPSPNLSDGSVQPLPAGPIPADQGRCKLILPENVADYAEGHHRREHAPSLSQRPQGLPHVGRVHSRISRGNRRLSRPECPHPRPGDTESAAGRYW